MKLLSKRMEKDKSIGEYIKVDEFEGVMKNFIKQYFHLILSNKDEENQGV